jgi:polar amino acid transport system substrate-binding protein
MARTPHRTALAALVLVPALLLAGCGSDDKTDASSGDSPSTTAAADSGALTAPSNLVSSGKLTACSDTPYEPFEFKDDSGKDTGYDIDLLRAIADEAGLDLTVKDLPFDGILGSMAAGDCDLVASAVTITDERKEQVDFSDPYFDADQSLLVKADKAGELSALDELGGKTIGVQSGTTGESYAKEHAKDSTIKSFEDSDGLFAAIEAGQIDAILQDLPVNAYRTTKDDSLEVVEKYTTGEQYGYAAEKGNTEMVTFLNDGLQALKDDGTFDEVYGTYFGES